MIFAKVWITNWLFHNGVERNQYECNEARWLVAGAV